MSDEVERWLAQAYSDLEDAEFNFKGERHKLACFLLGQELHLPEKLMGHCKELGPAYLYTRYPDVTRSKKSG